MEKFILWAILVLGISLKAQGVYAEKSPRLVSIGGGITEVVCALGFCDQLVAVDATSTYPLSLKGLPKLGYFRQLNAEGVMQQRADIIFLTSQAGPPPVITSLKKLGLPLQFINSDKTLQGARERIQQVAAVLGAEAQAQVLIATMEADLNQAMRSVKQIDRPIRALFIYASGRHQLMSAGKNTAADAMFELLGIKNAAEKIQGYVNLSAEGLLLMNPDLIVMTDNGQKSVRKDGGKILSLDIPGFELTQAGQQSRLVIVDDLLFLGFSHRLGEAALAFVEQLKGISWKSANR